MKTPAVRKVTETPRTPEANQSSNSRSEASGTGVLLSPVNCQSEMKGSSKRAVRSREAPSSSGSPSVTLIPIVSMGQTLDTRVRVSLVYVSVD